MVCSAGLAFHRLAPLLVVGLQVASDQLQPLLGPGYGLQLRPARLQPLLAGDFLALRDLLELGVDLGPLVFVQRELRQAALVVDRHRGPVFHRALDVVDADVVAEDVARVAVGLLDGRAREADERCAGQGVAHVGGESVDEVVLAAVSLVGDDHDVATRRQQRMPVALLVGKEFLDRGEDHASRLALQPSAQVGPVRGLLRRLAHQVPTA